MSAAEVLTLAFLIGVIAGLRSMMAPALVALAAHQGWINLQGTPLSFMGSIAALIIFMLGALGELVADQLPKTPARTAVPGLIARIVTGGLSGASIAVAGSQSLALGAVLGAVGGVVGAFGGFYARTGSVKTLKIPDIVIAILEDAIAIGGGLFIVSRF